MLSKSLLDEAFDDAFWLGAAAIPPAARVEFSMSFFFSIALRADLTSPYGAISAIPSFVMFLPGKEMLEIVSALRTAELR